MGERDGGKAFPSFAHPESKDGQGMCGMSLRDYFAAAAIPWASEAERSVTGNGLERMFGPRAVNIPRERVVAKLAFDLADAMLAARTQGSGHES